MKKYILTLIAALSIFLMPTVSAKVDLPEKTDHEKVKVYLVVRVVTAIIY